MYPNCRQAILRVTILIRAFMSDSEQEDKKKGNEGSKTTLQFDFLTLLAKSF